MTATYPLVWAWRVRPIEFDGAFFCPLPLRKGQRCRVIARGSMNSVLVEFDDGRRILTSRYAVRAP